MAEETIRDILLRFDQTVHQYNERSTRGYDLSYSTGVAIDEPARHESVEDLLAEADNLMYRQKKLSAVHL